MKAWYGRTNPSTRIWAATRNFQTLSTKAQILTLQGKTADADALMKEALPLGTVRKSTICPATPKQKRTKDAFDAFKGNYDRHPNEFTTNMGMARGYSATGDYKKALDYLKKARLRRPTR